MSVKFNQAKEMKKILIILSLCSLSAYTAYTLTCSAKNEILIPVFSYTSAITGKYLHSRVENLAMKLGCMHNGYSATTSEFVGRWLIYVPQNGTKVDVPRQLDQFRDELFKELSTPECDPDMDVSWEARLRIPDNWPGGEYQQPGEIKYDYYAIKIVYRGIVSKWGPSSNQTRKIGARSMTELQPKVLD